MNRLIISLIILLILTIISSVSSTDGGKNIKALLLVMAVIKFILVSFNFMELIKAHSFWKIAIFSYLSIFSIIILLILN